MQQVLILAGISGSGKSTFARQYVARHPNWLRINRDELRRSLVSTALADYWQWPQAQKNRIETLVTALQHTALHKALEQGWNVLVDNTHLRQRHITELVGSLENFAVEIRFKLLEVPLPEAIARDRNRPDAVGEALIREQHARLGQLKRQFDFEAVVTHRPGTASAARQDESLPKCVLVDIDGTVAQMDGRSAYDWHRVGEDQPKQNVINLVKSLKNHGYRIIFFSGRDGVCHPDSSAWLARHFGWQESVDFQLFMRRPGDSRKDSVVKRELYESHILGRYYVEMVIDDRDQVVAMWRKELGLTCLQVDYGNF